MEPPTPDVLAADAKEVVKFCNPIRKARGLGRINKPRRGVPMHKGACSLAMCLEGTGITSVDYSSERESLRLWKRHDEVVSISHRPAITRFMENFDAGLYPEYEIPLTDALAMKLARRGR